jgi:AcrR family transcriptional regulator
VGVERGRGWLSVSLSAGDRSLAIELGRGGHRPPRVCADAATNVRRARAQRALIQLAGEQGLAAVPVGQLVRRAGISRRTFYELYGGVEGCAIAVLDAGFARAREAMQAALAAEGPGPAGLRAALAELLALLDDEPPLARLWLLEAQSAGPKVLAHREQLLCELRAAIVARVLGAGERPEGAGEQRGAAPGPGSAPPANGSSRTPPAARTPGLQLAAEGTFAAVLGILEAHLRERRPGPLIDLLGPLMGLVVAPYLGLEGARREAERGRVLGARIATARAAQAAAAGNGASNGVAAPNGVPANGHAEEAPWELALPGMLANPSAHRARGCVLYLAAHPGASNREVAEAVGVRGKEQISKLLARLAHQQLVAKSSHGKGLANAWRLTGRGERAVKAMVNTDTEWSKSVNR